MLGTPNGFWGKLERDASGQVWAWHPLADHCADVAAVAEAILRLPVWRARLCCLAGRALSDTEWARLCVFVALHDLGKFNLGFRDKAWPERRSTTGHVIEAVGALSHCPAVFSTLAELTSWGDSAVELLIAALCHHGRPHHYKGAGIASSRTPWTPRDGLDPQTGLADLLTQCRRWFPAAFVREEPALPESTPFQHAFAGVVMLADWIGSDTKFFPFSCSEGDDRMDVSRRRAQMALERIGIDIPADARLDAHGRDPFSRVTPPERSPRPAQAVMLTLPSDRDGSITLLEAETGSGKTEAALARFVALFDAGLVDGLYFALPTRTAATQMHRRVRAAVQLAFQTPPPVVLAVPGYLRVDDTDGYRLAPFTVHWPDLESDRERHRAWAAENSKRYLAGTIAVGTIDQVLLSSLMVGHAHLRATSLLRQLLVVDEVHASDAYMGRILEDVLTRHRAAGGHALLLSATLGGEARARLMAGGARVTMPTLADAEATPYPLVSHRGDGAQALPVKSEGPGRDVHVTAHAWLEDPSALAKAAFSAALRGAKVLIIRNTVTNCVATQQAVEREASLHARHDLLFRCNGVAAPHHSRFARPDREALDADLERRFGESRPDGGCIVVATQTVQQSLDIDADLLFTDLCPMDVLLQRIGRLHRHRRTRPTGFDEARVFVVVPANRDLGVLIREKGSARPYHGLGSVYPDLRVLEATWRLIESVPCWRIPAMNRHLIERSLHGSVLDSIVREQGGAWKAHAEDVRGTVYGQQSLAGLNLVDRTLPYAESSFPDVTDQRILTRLGEGDRLVRFESPVMGPFGRTFTELTILAGWASAIPPDATVAKIKTIDDAWSSPIQLAVETDSYTEIVQFAFGNRTFIYGRLGLSPGTSPGTAAETDDGP